MATRKTATLTARKAAAGKTQKSEAKAPAIAEFDKNDELKAYREMLLIRRFEERPASSMAWASSAASVTSTSARRPL